MKPFMPLIAETVIKLATIVFDFLSLKKKKRKWQKDETTPPVEEKESVI